MQDTALWSACGEAVNTDISRVWTDAEIEETHELQQVWPSSGINSVTYSVLCKAYLYFSGFALSFYCSLATEVGVTLKLQRAPDLLPDDCDQR